MIPGTGAARPSILAVTSQLPWPLDSGGHLRTFHLLRALARSFRVRLVVPLYSGQEEGLEVLARNGISVRGVPMPRRRLWHELVRACTAALRGRPYVLYSRHDQPAVRAALEAELTDNRPDVLYLDHLDSTVFWTEQQATPAVVDMHNVYSLLVQRAAEERWGPGRLYLKREARLLDRMERRVRRAAAVLAVSEQETAHFAGLGAQTVHTVPNGVDCKTYASLPIGRCGGAPILLYVGAMSWAPNASAAAFLAQQVLPRVRDRFPQARLRIVGRDPSSEVQALGRLPAVEVTGTVPSMLPHLGEAALLAVPLESGGGTRLKILEAFAAGLPVISTAIGCEGLKANPGEHLLVMPRERFAEGILSLLSNEGIGRQLAQQARVLVREHYDWGAVGAQVCRAVALAGQPREEVCHVS
jgi:glycosyltransferase involved in cell wall biosynthesis